MSGDRKPPLLVFPQEIAIHAQLFEQTPLRIVEQYLQCFDSSGNQAFDVPRHVLEALARRFLSLMSGEQGSLDDAFGGRTAQQRNELLIEARDQSVLWELLTELERVRGEALAERGPGTPFEIAVERVGARCGMSPDNIRRIYRKGGPRGKRRKRILG